MPRREFVLLGIFLLFAVTGAAMCPVAVTPPNSFVHLTDESQGLVVWDDERQVETYVVRQGYEGVASDFGLILPTPSEPAIEKADGKLFRQLHDLTKEPADKDLGFGGTGTMTQSVEGQVEVVKQEQIGDFDLAVLRANASGPMLDWLDEHNYTYGPRTEENVQYYIDQGGFYFTAMKINVEEATCLTKEEFEFARSDRFRQMLPEDGTEEADRCWLRGGLSPVSFSFDADEPMLPLRIMAKPHDESPMTRDGHEGHDHTHETESTPLPPGDFLLYTVSDQPLTVPGAKVQYANRMGDVGEPLSRYNVSGRFLIRQRITFNAHEVEHDLVFRETEPFYQSREGSSIINPDEVDAANGMMVYDDSTARQVAFADSPGLLSEVDFRGERLSATVAGAASAAGTFVVQVGVVTLIGIPIVLAQAPLTTVPFLLIALLIGIVWSRRRTLFVAAGGMVAGAASGVFVLLLFESVIGTSYSLGNLALFMGAAGVLVGVLSFIVSTLARRFEVLDDVRQRMDALPVLYGVGTVGGAIGVSLVASRLVHGQYDFAEFLPLYGLPLTLLGLFLLYRREDDTMAIKHTRRDWLYLIGLVGLSFLVAALMLS